MTDSNSSDDQLRRILSAMDHEAAPVDHSALDSIRELAKNEVKNAVTVQRLNQSTPNRKANSVRRAVAVLLSSLVILLLAVFVKPTVANARPSLGQLLRELRSADSVAMHVERSGESVEIRYQSPGTVTWIDSEHKYRVADGHQLWKVDETATDSVAVEDSPIPLEGTDALELIGMGAIDESKLFQVFPEGTTKIKGQEALTYETVIPFKDQEARLKALADADTGELRVLQVIGTQQTKDKILAEVVLRERDDVSRVDVARLRRSLKDDGRVGMLAARCLPRSSRSASLTSCALTSCSVI